MPKRKQKKYSRPQKPFDKTRIEEENVLKDRYGLKNKKEIWKADAAIGRIRNQAKKLITASKEEKQKFVEKLQKKGFEIESIADSLGLNKENWLKRRLQTVVYKKGLTNTAKQARQLIVHKHVSIGNQIINKPSYQVSLEEAPLVKLNLSLKLKEPKKSKIEEIKEAVLEDGRTINKKQNKEKVNEQINEEQNPKNEKLNINDEENKEINEDVEEEK